MPRKGYVWVSVPEKLKFTANEKAEVIKKLDEFILTSTRLKEKVERSSIRGNRLYLYEQSDWIYARVTFNDKQGDNCSADWQRHNEQWIEFFKGSFIECLEFIENGGGFF